MAKRVYFTVGVDLDENDNAMGYDIVDSSCFHGDGFVLEMDEDGNYKDQYDDEELLDYAVGFVFSPQTIVMVPA